MLLDGPRAPLRFDSDVWTVADACDNGNCAAADTRIKAKVKPGVDDDRLKTKSKLPTDLFTVNPTTTGLFIETRDADDQSIHSGTLPAAGWEDKKSLGKKFTFRDRDGIFPGTSGSDKVSIKVDATKGEAKISVKAKDADPSVDDCLSGVHIPCTGKTTTTSCK